jgi:prephenate dehydrogenase
MPRACVMTSPSSRRAHVVGLGLIGASIALALQEQGWTVSGVDLDHEITSAALSTGVISLAELTSDVDLVVIAVPAGVVASVAASILESLDSPSLIVTDVAGVKGSIVDRVLDPSIPRRPPDGRLGTSRSFGRARRPLCRQHVGPHAHRPHVSGGLQRLHGVLREIGANVVAISADDHDRLVAVASHVPHLWPVH